MGQHVDHGLFQGHAGQVHGGQLALHGGHVAVHLGRLAQQHVHGHVHGELLVARGHGRVLQHQLALLGGRADHGKRAALALAEGREFGQRFGRDGQYIAFLAFVGPDFLGRQAGFLQVDGAQVEARATARIVGQLGEGIGQAAGTHVVDGQDGVLVTLGPAVVDDFLGAALDLGVAALHGVEVQLGRVRAAGHGAGSAAAHADAHAGAAQLDQQGAGGELDLARQLGVDHAQAARDHDGLVVAAHHGIGTHADLLLVLAEIAGQVGTAELVVEGRATERALDHDLQRAGDVLGLAHFAAPQLGDREARQAGLGLGAAARGALVADLAARASRCAGEGGDGRGVVVRLHLHEDVVDGLLLLVAGRLDLVQGRLEGGDEALDLMAFHDGGVVRVGHHRVLGRDLVRVADHAEQALVLGHAVNGELGVEDLVAAVLAVGLREHHQLHVRGIALQALEGVDQVVDLVVGQCQAPLAVGSLQRRAAAAQHIDELHGSGFQGGEQLLGLGARGEDRFGHAVVQQGRDLRGLLGRQLGLATE
ncbi:MAG: hypothetical protein GAK34_03561 [Delftia tsuruhatensis]|nr:MAG: hypothetical protein GAK34_03561 [Delftia tsuruhatensis]